MFDVTIIGAGVSGIFLAYKLQQTKPELKVHIIDRGKKLENRICSRNHEMSCACKDCPTYFGFGGLFKSEGKFNYTNDFGGGLGKKVGNQKAIELMEEVDEILCSFGADQVERYSTKNEELESLARTYGMDVLSTDVRHLGTKLAIEILQTMYVQLKRSISFTFEAKIQTVSPIPDGFMLVSDKGEFLTRKLVMATGMSGSTWLQEQCLSLGIAPTKTRVDLGVRVEMKKEQMAPLLQKTFETKLKIKGKDYEATTYCMNPGGRIVRKHHNGLVMADGQNYREKGTLTENLNFSLFLPRFFPSYEEAAGYSRSIIEKVNDNRDRIVVQRLEDVRKNRRTTKERLSQNSIRPTLKGCESGSVVEMMPDVYICAFLEMAQALEGLIREPIHDDTLLYALDAKFYEASIQTSTEFETELPGLFLIGDCSGDTHSLSQAAASGIYVGERLGRR